MNKEVILKLARVTSGGLVTIPSRIRNIMRVSTGDYISWIRDQFDNIIIKSTNITEISGTIIAVSKISKSSLTNIPSVVRDILGVKAGNDIIFILKDNDIIVKLSIESTDTIINHKLETALEIVCALYKNNFIEDAYIVGSVATGEAKKESDIDIVIINRLFEANLEFFFLQISYEQDPIYEDIVSEFHPIVKQIIQFLEDLGVRTTLSEKVIAITPDAVPETIILQTFKGELVQLWGDKDKSAIKGPSMRITKRDCI